MTDQPTTPDPSWRVAAGRKGGTTTAQRYGPDFYARIAKLGASKGGTTTRDRYGLDYYVALGIKSAEARRQRAGRST